MFQTTEVPSIVNRDKPPKHRTKRASERPASPISEKKINILDIPVITYKELNEKYQRSETKLGEGSFGVVYLTVDGKHAVKRFQNTLKYSDFTKELNAYAKYQHPCIMEVKAVCLDEGRGYFVMPKGIPIKRAYRNNLITIKEIVSDLFSVLDFLHSNGVIHGDLKPANMVYHDGKLKLIDFGKCRRGTLNKDGEWYFTGPSYTSWYKDPEYSDDQNNNIKCEIHSAAICIMEIMRGDAECFGSLYNYTTKNSYVNWFIENAQKVIGERKPISYFLDDNNLPEDLENHIIRRHTGTVIEDELPIDHYYTRSDRKLIKMLMGWLITVSRIEKILAETLFFCIHLIHRLMPKYNIIMGRDKCWEEYQLLCCVCMHISFQMTDEDYTDVRKWMYFTCSKDKLDTYLKKFAAMFNIVLSLINCNISSTTYWDLAKSKDDLPALLSDLVKSKFHPGLIRNSGTNSDKNVNVSELLPKKDFEIYSNVTNTRCPVYLTPLSPHYGNISPCEIDTSENVIMLKKCVNLFKWDDKDLDTPLTIIMHNRKGLKDLPEEDALLLFKNLIKKSHKSKYNKVIFHILQSSCDFNVIENGANVIQMDVINPFILTENDFKK